ncbi:fungal-specific transcription factor domain-containing protein [Xylaria arbuscula]|nr:fungal-specific transcription factor domain-containing protein [Xylaria arbuscula]
MSSLACEGYAPQLCWVVGDAALRNASVPQRPEPQSSNPGSGGFRFPLYSETYRRQMSVQVSDSLCDHSAAELLVRLDVACADSGDSATAPKDIMLGPFGVFDLKAPTHDESQPSPSQTASLDEATEGFSHFTRSPDSDTNVLPGDEIDKQMVDGDTSESQQDPLLETIELSYDDTDQIQPYFDLDTLTDQLMPHSFFPDDPSAFLSRSFGEDLPPVDEATEQIIPVNLEHGGSSLSQLDTTRLQENLSLDTLPLANGTRPAFVTDEAAQLLRYAKERLAQPLSRMQASRKSPWQLLFLPCAFETFSELLILGSASHTRSAIFHATLARSAFQLHMATSTNTPSNRWLEIGTKHRDNAKLHLNKALQWECLGPSQAQYKDLLMAILAVAMTMAEAKVFVLYLLDAERLICHRGLGARKSSSIRLLHHMYTHLRVLAESTAAFNQCEVINEKESSTSMALQLRQFQVSADLLNCGLDPTHQKVGEVGYNDIHLQVQGTWKETLYPSIYGLPEPIMTLLSQIIAFANNKSRLEHLAQQNPSITSAIASHTRTLENAIWSWSLPPLQMGPERPENLEEIQSDGGSLHRHPNTQSMALAVHQAVLIYFYRRIHNISVMMLQDLVRKTLDYLQPCLEETVEDQDFCAIILWSAFIAGCEAASPDLQDKALEGIIKVEQRCTMFLAEPASQFLKKVWRLRQRSGDQTLSWPHAIIQNNDVTCGR